MKQQQVRLAPAKKRQIMEFKPSRKVGGASNIDLTQSEERKHWLESPSGTSDPNAVTVQPPHDSNPEVADADETEKPGKEAEDK